MPGDATRAARRRVISRQGVAARTRLRPATPCSATQAAAAGLRPVPPGPVRRALTCGPRSALRRGRRGAMITLRREIGVVGPDVRRRSRLPLPRAAATLRIRRVSATNVAVVPQRRVRSSGSTRLAIRRRPCPATGASRRWGGAAHVTARRSRPGRRPAAATGRTGLRSASSRPTARPRTRGRLSRRHADLVRFAGGRAGADTGHARHGGAPRTRNDRARRRFGHHGLGRRLHGPAPADLPAPPAAELRAKGLPPDPDPDPDADPPDGGAGDDRLFGRSRDAFPGGRRARPDASRRGPGRPRLRPRGRGHAEWRGQRDGLEGGAGGLCRPAAATCSMAFRLGPSPSEGPLSANSAAADPSTSPGTRSISPDEIDPTRPPPLPRRARRATLRPASDRGRRPCPARSPASAWWTRRR